MNTRSLLCLLVLLLLGFSGDHRARANTGETPTKNDWSRSPLFAGRGENKTTGGGAGTKSSVLAALGWLVRHEASVGGWSSMGFHGSCRDTKQPCENKNSDRFPSSGGFPDTDIGVTGLSLLAFLARGNTHIEAESPGYQEVIRRAGAWLIGQQIKKGDKKCVGRIGAASNPDIGTYNHAIATLALCELLLGSGDRAWLGAPAQAAVEHVLTAQAKGFGWKYTVGGERSDTSVTGWMTMAVLAGRECAAAGLIQIPAERFESSLANAVRWIEIATSEVSGRTGYEAPGDEGSRLQKNYPDEFPFEKAATSSCTAIAVLVRALTGAPSPEGSISILTEGPPSWVPWTSKQLSRINLYYWYYATHALFQLGGKRWETWNKALKSTLVKNQRRTGCEKGSWDPIGEWGPAGGRVYSTAMGALTLTVYYGYARVAKSH